MYKVDRTHLKKDFSNRIVDNRIMCRNAMYYLELILDITCQDDRNKVIDNTKIIKVNSDSKNQIVTRNKLKIPFIKQIKVEPDLV